MLKVDNLRINYSKSELLEENMNQNPFLQFELWLKEALEQNVNEPNAFVLSTVDASQKPHARIVLIKEISENGLTFFTNYESNKAKEISTNNFACATFFYPEMERQIRIEGKIEKISREKSEKYFHSRPIESQIGAIASKQSSIIPNRNVLENKKNELEEVYKNKTIPLPENWGGYCLIANYFEFWQGRPNRLHDRIVYQKENLDWKINRLSP